ncbi:hypothetical protein G6F56_012077 [Rhizopus delemar]|nr:hypothetical protein G6F56_012077 [Rhizopus delemar]
MYQNQETGDLEERTAATLIPIIFKYVHPGATIRSDGWRAYNGLHGPSSPYNHEVCNHSVGFLTQDEEMTNGTSGRTHTNAIEGLWAQVKHCVPFRERTAELCPARLVEYLWRYRHQSNMHEGFNQALRSALFDPSESRTPDLQHGGVQLETQQGDSSVVSQVERTSDGLCQPPAFWNYQFKSRTYILDWNTMVYQDFISSLLPENEGAPMVIVSDQSDENEELSGANSTAAQSGL